MSSFSQADFDSFDELFVLNTLSSRSAGSGVFQKYDTEPPKQDGHHWLRSWENTGNQEGAFYVDVFELREKNRWVWRFMKVAAGVHSQGETLLCRVETSPLQLPSNKNCIKPASVQAYLFPQITFTVALLRVLQSLRDENELLRNCERETEPPEFDNGQSLLSLRGREQELLSAQSENQQLQQRFNSTVLDLEMRIAELQNTTRNTTRIDPAEPMYVTHEHAIAIATNEHEHAIVTNEHATFFGMGESTFCCLVVGGSVLCILVLMCVLFAVFFRRKKLKWQALKMRDMIQLQRQMQCQSILTGCDKNKEQKTDVIPGKAHREEPLNPKQQRLVWKDPEEFSDLMSNSVVVQESVLDDIHVDIETKGKDGEK